MRGEECRSNLNGRNILTTSANVGANDYFMLISVLHFRRWGPATGTSTSFASLRRLTTFNRHPVDERFNYRRGVHFVIRARSFTLEVAFNVALQFAKVIIYYFLGLSLIHI